MTDLTEAEMNLAPAADEAPDGDALADSDALADGESVVETPTADVVVSAEPVESMEPVEPVDVVEPQAARVAVSVGRMFADAIRRAADDSIRAMMLIRTYRVRGHLAARLDPLKALQYE